MIVAHQPSEIDVSDNANTFALAIVVLRERVRLLSRDDQNDLYELLPALLGEDEEERLSAQVAVKEIFDQATGKLQQMELPEAPSESLANWVAFVSNRIKTAREAAGMTQEQLSAKCGLHQTHICKLENGQHSPTRKTLQKIADAIGCPVSDFDPSVR